MAAGQEACSSSSECGRCHGNEYIRIDNVYLAVHTADPGEIVFSGSNPTTGVEGDVGETNYVEISVLRQNGDTGAATVMFEASPGTTDPATADVDFVYTNGTLEWAADDSDPKTFEVGIIGDAVSEPGNETILLTLSNATGAALGTLTNLTLTIPPSDVATTPAVSNLMPSAVGTHSATLRGIYYEGGEVNEARIYYGPEDKYGDDVTGPRM